MENIKKSQDKKVELMNPIKIEDSFFHIANDLDPLDTTQNDS